MTTLNRKLVVCLDEGTSTYKPAAHNLSPEQAIDHAKTLEADHISARVLDQDSRHRTLDPKKCRACGSVAKKLTEEHNARSADQQPPDVAAASGDHSEED